MKWLKAALVGALGSLVMFGILFFGIHVTGFAPFNQPPSAAFLTQLGLDVGPLPLLVHFGYGAFWAVVLLAWKGEETQTATGIGLALGLWVFMMLVYSPMIGWGVFGAGGTATQLPPDHPLYLGSTVKYVAATLILHLVYGSVIGYGVSAWVAGDATPSSARGSMQQAAS